MLGKLRLSDISKPKPFPHPASEIARRPGIVTTMGYLKELLCPPR